MKDCSCNQQYPFFGTEIKLNIHIEPIGSKTMDDYDFEVEFFCYANQSLIVQKKQMKRIDGSNYLCKVDTAKVGRGELKCKVTARVPDGDFEDNLRTEVAELMTGIKIR